MLNQGTFEVRDGQVGLLELREQIVEEASGITLFEKWLILPYRSEVRANEYGYHVGAFISHSVRSLITTG